MLIRERNQEGSAILFVSLTASVFIILSAGVLYTTVFNGKNLRFNKKTMEMSIVTDSGTQAALSKVEAAYRGVNLQGLKANILFESLNTDAVGTTAMQKAFSNENFNQNKG